MQSIPCTPYKGLKGVGRETPFSLYKSNGYALLPTPYGPNMYTLLAVGTAAAYWPAASGRPPRKDEPADKKGAGDV